MLWLLESKQLKAEGILRSDRHFEKKTASLEPSLLLTFEIKYHNLSLSC